jgi:hypothetical protein
MYRLGKRKPTGSARTSFDNEQIQRSSESDFNIINRTLSVRGSRESLQLSRSTVNNFDDENSDTSTEVTFGTDLSKFIRSALSGTSYDIARLVHYIYKDHYRVARLKTKSWYVHDGMKWKPTEVGPYFELSTSIAQLFDTYLHINSTIPACLEHEEEQLCDKEREKKIETIQKILSKLKNVNTKEMICKECVYLFYDPDFLFKLDISPNIVCFNNGVLDIERDDFREGTSDDMISLHIDMNFVPPKLQKDHGELAKVVEQFQEFRIKVVNKRKNRYIFSTT